MNQRQSWKAGPSAVQPVTWRVSKWQYVLKALSVGVLLGVFYATFTRYFPGERKHPLSWQLYENENGTAHKTLKGSQYLLGVGKADITG